MSDANLDATGLGGVGYQGLIHEDVMDRIYDISKIPLPLTDMIGSDDMDNPYKEWTSDKLQTPDITNAQIDGSEQAGNDSNPDEDGAVSADGEPLRMGNHAQISTKVVRVSTRARNTNNIGRGDEMSYQVMMRQRELRRDVEAIMLTNQASVADNGVDAAGKSAGLGAWLSLNIDKSADGVAGGFDEATGLVAAYTPGTKRALTEPMVRDVCEAVFTEGGDPSVFMSVPGVIRKFSEYLFTSSARIATLQSETGQSKGAVTAKGSVNVFVTDFGVVLDLVPNRIQQDVVAGMANAYLIDPAYLSQAFLHGYRVEPLAKTGLADARLMCVDWTLVVNTQRAHGAIFDIDTALAVTDGS